MTADKLQAIRDYLLKHFPNEKHADENDFDRLRHKFRIAQKGQILLLAIHRDSIDDNDTKTLIHTLDMLRVIDALKNNPQSIVVVWQQDNRGGIKIETRN